MYKYEEQKPKVFLEENQRDFLTVYDTVKQHPAQVISMGEAIANISGDAWGQMVYVDRLVELALIVEVQQPEGVPAQHRIFRIVK